MTIDPADLPSPWRVEDDQLRGLVPRGRSDASEERDDRRTAGPPDRRPVRVTRGEATILIGLALLIVVLSVTLLVLSGVL